jgi:hypothetical protein
MLFLDLFWTYFKVYLRNRSRDVSWLGQPLILIPNEK